MPATRSTRRRPAPKDKRAAILDAALDLFVERGFHGTAVPLVAERAGVGAGTIYRYFASKEEIVNTLYQEWKGRITGEALAVADLKVSPREQFHIIWRKLFRFAADHPRVFAFLEFHFHGSYLDERSRALESRVIALGVALIERLQREKVVKPTAPDVLLIIIYWSFVGLVRAGLEGKIVLDDAAIDAAEQCIWESVRT